MSVDGYGLITMYISSWQLSMQCICSKMLYT